LISALTLVETAFGVALLGLFAATLLAALSAINQTAAVARNQTAARIAVESEIDRLLRLVYSPPVAVPTEFAVEGQTDNRKEIARTVDLFAEEAGGPVPIRAELRTIAEPLDAANRPRLLRLSVSALYTYRGRAYRVEAATVRSPDI